MTDETKEGNKIVMSFKDRLVIGAIFPEKGGLLTQTMIRDIKEKVNITQEEFKEVGFIEINNMSRWDQEKETPKDMTLTDMELEFLKGRVRDLDKQEAITQDIFDLCIKLQKM